MNLHPISEATGPRPWRAVGVALVAALGAWVLTRYAPQAWVEQGYARGVFPVVRRNLSFFAGLFPVSLSELLVLALTLRLLWLVLRGLARWRSGERGALQVLGRGLDRLVRWAAWGYVAFVLLWGLNHRRPTLAELLDLQVRPSQREELEALWDDLVDEAIEARRTLALDVEEVFELPEENADWWPALEEAWQQRSEPALAGSPAVLRRAWISPLMTAGRITGIYSPFTGESHVNGQVPAVTLPFTALHEMAHARGIAREDSANYLAARVGRSAADPRLRYSAAWTSLLYVRRALQPLPPKWPVELAADRQVWREFWLRDRGVLVEVTAKVTERVNDAYLKSQGDARGTRSYGAVVDLLLAERRANRR